MSRVRIAAEVALVVLRDRSGRILMQHRTDDAPRQPNKWTPPGGQIEPGETPVEGAHRELYEETGLRVDELVLHAVYERPASDGDAGVYMFHVFTAETDATQEDVVLGEGKAMVFLTASEIAEVELTPFAARLLPEFL